MNEKELFEKVYDVLFEHDPELRVLRRLCSRHALLR